MKRLEIVPEGWPCKLEECPPGFFIYEESLCFLSEYGGTKVEAFCDTGEAFCVKNAVVQPVDYQWVEED